MKVEVTTERIKLGENEFLPQDVKVTIFLRKKHKGLARLVALTVVYGIILFAVYRSPFDVLSFDYAFLVYFPLAISFILFLFNIFSHYYLEYAKIQVPKGDDIRLPYTGSGKVIVDKIAIIADSVSWE